MESGCLKNDFGHPFHFFYFRYKMVVRLTWLFTGLHEYLNFWIQNTVVLTRILVIHFYFASHYSTLNQYELITEYKNYIRFYYQYFILIIWGYCFDSNAKFIIWSTINTKEICRFGKSLNNIFLFSHCEV